MRQDASSVEEKKTGVEKEFNRDWKRT